MPLNDILRREAPRIVRVRGRDLLNNPLLNKGTAFSEVEREIFGLHGLLPPVVETLEAQCQRAYQAFTLKSNDLERHIYLRQLHDLNEVLFYQLLLDHIDEMLPVVYTPAVAIGCQAFSHIYRRPRGLFIPYPRRHSIPELLRNYQTPEVDVIVVTDGERILGIGDQGVGGLGIPIGKLTLYTLIGGIHPERTLPIVLDVGTNNKEHLLDPKYLGWRHSRVTGAEYEEFIDSFVKAVQEVHPEVMLQWEDFAGANAQHILRRYRDKLLTFNDDIQGTAAVTLAAILAGVRVAGSTVVDQEFVFFGAGAASIGVADYVRKALLAEGLSDQQARSRIWMVNRGGLLHDGRSDLTTEQRVYAQPVSRLTAWSRTEGQNLNLSIVIKHVRATVLIGLSTLPRAFTESIVREMSSKTERPIIFPLSNPTDRSEACPEDLLRWTKGRALVATGSPYPPVQLGDRTLFISQCNNAYIFPALGLALVASRHFAETATIRRITDDMLLAAARALAELSPAVKDSTAPLLPSFKDIRSTSIDIALAIASESHGSGLAVRSDSASKRLLRSQILASQWFPVYESYILP